MSRRTITIAAALSVLALGSQLIAGCTNTLATQYFDQGTEKYEAGNYQGAITDLTKALEILSAEPSDFTVHSDAYYIRGNAREKLNDLDGACSDWRKAAEVDPEYKEPAELVRLRC